MEFEAVVVGSGPNGLSAAIEIARQGHSVCVLEGRSSVGGGARTAELTLPGFRHDVCSAIHPLGIASPFFKSLPLDKLDRHGLTWIHSPAAVAHPFDDGTAAILEKSIERTGETLGPDAGAYANCFRSFAENAGELVPEILAPVMHVPRRPLLMMQFGLQALQSASGYARRRFRGPRAQALFAGIAAHANMPLDMSPTASFGLLLAMLGHAGGWPLAQGGSQSISNALASHLESLGGRILTDRNVKSFGDIPSARAVLFDVPPRELLAITGDRFPASYRRKLETFRHGPGVFKVDWALSAPAPWKARECGRAATLHLGGSLEELVAAEAAVAAGKHPERPYVIFAQQSQFDPARAPAGKHTAWGYCHVPNGSSVDMTERIESQVERFAPGFRDCVIARHTMSTRDFEAYNRNYIGGDISGGIQNLWQVLARPSFRPRPYITPAEGLYICSSSTPPGGGVHGMCGYHAARAALSRFY